MTVEQLSRPSQVLELWSFFEEGLRFLESAAREHFDVEQMQKLVCQLAAEPVRGYVAVVFSDSGDPVCFGIAQESTQLFSKTRTFEVQAVYHVPNNHLATLSLEGHFENWCRERGVKRYSLSTRRKTGATIRCFRHARYGFSKPYLVFEKEVL